MCGLGGVGWGMGECVGGGARLRDRLSNVGLARVCVVVHEVAPAPAVRLHDAHVGCTLATELR